MITRRTLFGLIPAAAVAYVTTRAGCDVQEQTRTIGLDFGTSPCMGEVKDGYIINLGEGPWRRPFGEIGWLARSTLEDEAEATRYFTKLESEVDFK